MQSALHLFGAITLYTSALLATDAEQLITLGAGMSHSIELAQLSSVTVASGKIARARAIPPSTLVITGLKTGITTVRAWVQGGKEYAYQVEVVPAALAKTRTQQGVQVVRVALEFIEVDSTLSQSLGIRWPEALRFTGSGSILGQARMTGLNYSIGFDTAQGFLAQMVRDGWAKILARPELYVRLGELAKFHSGGEIPITTSANSFGQIQQRVEWKKYGMSVTVRPTSLDTIAIQSDVQLEVSEPNPSHSVAGIPALLTRQVDTKIDSNDGETVVLSGLVREVESEHRDGIPLLKDIPLLGGWLFSTTNKQKEGTELLMSLTVSFATKTPVSEKIRTSRQSYDQLEL